MTSAQMNDMSLNPDPADASEVAPGESVASVMILTGAASRRSDRAYETGKRLFDFTASILLLFALSPFLLATAFLIVATSPGPMIFRQERCGREGRRFTCYKFRTMVNEAEGLKQSLLQSNEMTGPVFKMHNDPRVTPLGRILRKLSIDELPQLWNVARGDMSLVGPRPPLPDEVASYTPREYTRLSVPPGITCLWQISGRSNLSFERWIDLDLEYINRRGFWFDMWVLVRTIPAVFTGRGAL